jgi:hypothetical protein
MVWHKEEQGWKYNKEGKQKSNEIERDNFMWEIRKLKNEEGQVKKEAN